MDDLCLCGASARPITINPVSFNSQPYCCPFALRSAELGNELCIRVFPDQPFVMRTGAADEEEHNAGFPLHEVLKSKRL